MEALSRAMARPGPADLVQVSRLDVYDGARDALAIKTWLFSAREVIYIPLRDAAVAAVAAARAAPGTAGPGRTADELRRDAELKAIRAAATYFRGPALVWWMATTTQGSSPGTWDEFSATIEATFTPPHAARAARDVLATLRQSRSVEEYVNEFARVTLMIPRLTEEERLDRFVRGLKPKIKVEVLKADVASVTHAARVASAAESAYGGSLSLYGSSAGHDGPAPMDLGAVSAGALPSRRRQKKNRDGCWNCGKEDHVRATCPDLKGLAPSRA